MEELDEINIVIKNNKQISDDKKNSLIKELSQLKNYKDNKPFTTCNIGIQNNLSFKFSFKILINKIKGNENERKNICNET